MTELIDNPPPLPEPFGYCREWQGDDSDLNNWLFETDKCELDDETWCSLFTDAQYRAGEAAAFARGVATNQALLDRIDRLEAEKAMERNFIASVADRLNRGRSVEHVYALVVQHLKGTP